MSMHPLAECEAIKGLLNPRALRSDEPSDPRHKHHAFVRESPPVKSQQGHR
jgi:hypothetical protein